MAKRYSCIRCKSRFASYQLRALHEEIAHLDDADDAFLPEPEPVEKTPDLSYLQIIAKKAERFPAYKRYLGHGTDFYNERGMSEAIVKMRGK
ncbi:MAG: hypothetical protein QFB87_04605 [Patescibacteria group bacterium]|nr:hypothetical protein [Patescibacteria group bacterium]